MTAGDRHREGTPFAFTETILSTNRLWYPCVQCGLETTAREGEPEPMCQTCLMNHHGAHPNIQGTKPKYLRVPGDTTPVREPGVQPLTNTYVPDPEPVIRPPLTARTIVTPKYLGRGALIVYNAAIRHGWLVDITTAVGYHPDSEDVVESFALRVTRDDRHAVAVWENNNVSCVYYWEGKAQPAKVKTTDLTGQRLTKHREFKEALFNVGWTDNGGGRDRRTATSRVPRQREGKGKTLTWDQVEEGDTVAALDESRWVVRKKEQKTEQRANYVEFTLSRPDGTGEFSRNMFSGRGLQSPAKVVETAERAAIAILGEVEILPEPIPTGVWFSEILIEECRQRGVGCSHEVCKWDRQKRRRRHSDLGG